MQKCKAFSTFKSKSLQMNFNIKFMFFMNI